jgi:hypothetical protein
MRKIIVGAMVSMDGVALCNHQERSNDPHHHRF